MSTDFDILISGSGMVGSSLACLLAPLGFRIGLIEARTLQVNTPNERDERAIALSYTSRRILQPLWHHCAPYASPIEHIIISQRGSFGAIRLHASELGVDALGQVIPAHQLAQTLLSAVNQEKRLTTICPATLKNIISSDDHIQVNLETADGAQNISARLLIAADGSHSTIRTLMQISTLQQHYDQHAIVATVGISGEHLQTAHERFQAGGPLALLPLSDKSMATILVVKTADLAALLALSDRAFLAELQKQFGFGVGKFTWIGQRQHWPLQRQCAEELIKPRVAIIGNAANTLHPLAAQGFNLGLRDVALLIELLGDPLYQHDPGNREMLAHYQRIRQPEQKQVMAFTDFTAHIFHTDFLPLTATRAEALRLFNKFPWLKQRLANFGMGRFGFMPWNAL